MSKKGKTRTNKKYSPEFKATVVKDLLSNQLSYAYTIKKYGLMYGNSDAGARLMIQR